MGNTICVKCYVPVTHYNEENIHRYSCRQHRIINGECIDCNNCPANCRHIWRQKLIFCC